MKSESSTSVPQNHTTEHNPDQIQSGSHLCNLFHKQEIWCYFSV